MNEGMRAFHAVLRLPRRKTAMLFALLVIPWVSLAEDASPANPFESEVRTNVHRLQADFDDVRSAAAEALGFMRAYEAADALVTALGDPAAGVRREAAMALAWCGKRRHVPALLDALGDADWTVRQAAWVSLTNLTGMEWPYDAQAISADRTAQAEKWRDWWGTVHDGEAPAEVLALAANSDAPVNLALNAKATASSTYKGPVSVLTDGEQGGMYWQTKNVPFPQSCVVDLGEPVDAAYAVVYQYGAGYCMTDYAVEVSADGRSYAEVAREKGVSEPTLIVPFSMQPVRSIRVTSFNSQNRTYPTTFFEIEVLSALPRPENEDLRVERGLRALGALGGAGAAQAVAKVLEPYKARDAGTPSGRHMVQAGIRSLGRLGDPETFDLLVAFLNTPQWGRYAADALGDFGGDKAAAVLIEAYPQYARDVKYRDPKRIPSDDRPGLSPVDRSYETPFAIAAALARLPLDERAVVEGVREISPLLLTNLPGDFDAALLYDEEAHQRVVRYLLAKANMLDTARLALFAALEGNACPAARGAESIYQAAQRTIADVPHAAAWLPVLSTERDTGRLIAMLGHENGWVRINAAKSLVFLNQRQAVQALADALRESRPEAEYGYYGEFRFYEKQEDGTDVDAHDEYNDPSPRWREAFVRALGELGDSAEVGLLVSLMNDDRNVLDIQYAAAMALNDLGSPEALAALTTAEADHPYQSIRLVAREALWQRGELDAQPGSVAARRVRPATSDAVTVGPLSVVFIKGPNEMPNDFQIDPWRQTYSTTDSGPTYRLGNNLYRLDLAAPGRLPKALTHFREGYVADCEVSWDGTRIVFARRGGDTDPWWHIYEVLPDGTGLRQLTDGPYHDVQPAYLPDGRIVFSSSRMGLRDEYHGYLSTGLSVMNPDGSDIRVIGFNLGRDNEPAVLDDGRIVFSRLDLFYSRLKTELTVQAVYPDGTHNVTLYGPERRPFWRQVTIDSGERWWGEVPTRHRVLRLTQPQPLDAGRVLCASTNGLTILGPGRYKESVIPHDKDMAVTTPFPLGDGRILCAATRKQISPQGKPVLKPGDLGLYIVDADSGAMTLLYNDPATAEFEGRPIRPRKRPPVLAESNAAHGNSYTATFACRSARTSREVRVGERGKLVRVIEGMPITGRHRTHTAKGENAWRNHTGTLARVLGTVPLSADGSFHVEVPADRLIHFQVLDSDRRVVGNQLVWMYARPREARSCVGCHETPDSTARERLRGFPKAVTAPPVQCLPRGGEFTYRAKFWNKGVLPDEGEERTRTVRAVNLMARH